MSHTPPAKSAAAAPRGFQPYIPASQSLAEFTVKAVVLGALFGLIFGASTVYLGLRAGLTVSASIPIAVLAISVLKRLGGSTILENNIVQTIGSAGESVAAGVVFTVPALLFFGERGQGFFNYFQITMLAFAGGILGVLMMVPLRRALIVKEHGVLPYPEGTACADVLVAGERGGALAKTVFQGLAIGALWKSVSWIIQIFPTAIGRSLGRTSIFPNATLNVDISPEYMGVGYVIGPRIAGVMFAGGVLSWLVLLPLLSIMGNYLTVPFPPVPASGLRIDQMSPNQLWSAYIRYTGAGAVLASGLITLARTIPTIVSSFRDSMKDFSARGTGAAVVRTERDIPMTVVLAGTVLLAIFLAIAPGLPTQGNFLVSALVIIFGFFFVTVSSRIVGLIGSSSNPVSGMTIATLILTCTIFVALGWTGEWYSPIALCVGAVVCIAAANAGATSQDLKTGYIVGATPIYQQYGLIIGVLVSAMIIGYTTLLPASGDEHRIGSAPGTAGDAHEHDYQGAAQPEPAVGPGAGRRLHFDHARAVRHPLALVRRRFVSADFDDRAHLRRRPGPRLRGTQDGHGRGVRSRIRHALQLGPHRRRLARGNSLRNPLRQRDRARSRCRRQSRPGLVSAQRHERAHRRGPALFRARHRAGARGTA